MVADNYDRYYGDGDIVVEKGHSFKPATEKRDYEFFEMIDTRTATATGARPRIAPAVPDDVYARYAAGFAKKVMNISIISIIFKTV